jgi:endonuclease G
MKKTVYSFFVLTGFICLCVACGGKSTNTNGLSNDSIDQESVEGLYTTVTDPVTGEVRKELRQKSMPLEQPAPMNGVPEQILKRKSYITSYNKDTKIPNWVAWHLTSGHTRGNLQRHDNLFHEDMDVTTGRVTDDDYYNSGYDRGHMCPAGDNKWDQKAMNETFLFTNICPQIHALNEGPWNDLEMACRRWAQKYGDIYIVCGPLLSEGLHRTIGKRRVVVPERFFKVILCMQDKPKAIGFIYDNNSRNSNKMFSHATTIDEIERLTGIDFFPSLEDKIENVVEAERGYF